MRSVFSKLLGWALLVIQSAVAFLGHGLHSFSCYDPECAGHHCYTSSCDSHAAGQFHAHRECVCAKRALGVRKGIGQPRSGQAHASCATFDSSPSRLVVFNRKRAHDPNCAICHLLALGKLRSISAFPGCSLSDSGQAYLLPEVPCLAERFTVARPRSPPCIA